MIDDLNRRLSQAAENRSRREKLQRQAAGLQDEFRQAKAQEQDLRRRLTQEERDVERLEGASLSGLLASLFTNREERLVQERQEAMAAQLKYDEARVRCERLIAELGRVQAELAGVGGSEADYSALLEQKERLIRAGSDQGAQTLLRFGEEEQRLDWQRREIDEARRAGLAADSALGRVEASLDSAAGWGTWDILGGGLIATAAKHSRMDDARQELYGAQEALARFRREVKDVQASVHVPEVADLDGFTRFADYFFDGLFADIAVQSRINESLRSVQGSRNQVVSMLNWLEEQARRVEANLQELRTRRQQFIEGYRGQ